MDDLTDDFFNKFAKMFKDYFKAFNLNWIVNNGTENAFVNFKREDFAYWFILQYFMVEKINQFVEKLPSDFNEYYEEMKKAVEKFPKP